MWFIIIIIFLLVSPPILMFVQSTIDDKKYWRKIKDRWKSQTRNRNKPIKRIIETKKREREVMLIYKRLTLTRSIVHLYLVSLFIILIILLLSTRFISFFIEIIKKQLKPNRRCWHFIYFINTNGLWTWIIGAL